MKKLIETKRTQEILKSLSLEETPFSVIDLEKIKNNLNIFAEYFSLNRILYPVKANSDMSVLRLLAESGCSFDAASINEVEMLLELGVDSEKICFGNTIKKRRDIRRAFQYGIMLYTTDSLEDFNVIEEVAPDSEVFIRIQCSEVGDSDWPLSKKFGCTQQVFNDILNASLSGTVDVKGLSFHVGSQQKDLSSWKIPLKTVVEYVGQAQIYGVQIQHINIGGGIPTSYKNVKIDLPTYLKELNKTVTAELKEIDKADIWVEPGRGLVADAGFIVTEVILIKWIDNVRWVFIDIGKYGGLAECQGEAIKYDIVAIDRQNGIMTESVIAGPTCDSTDILYENERYFLPANLESGDRLIIYSTGAYTAEYSSVGFNGYGPLKQIVSGIGSTVC